MSHKQLLFEVAAQVDRLLGAFTPTQAHIKADCSPVTLADLSIQVIVNRLLRSRHADCRILAEESSQALPAEIIASVAKLLEASGIVVSPAEVTHLLDYRGNPASERFWILDPIDGTKGFIRGGQFAVALALYEAQNPLLGCLISPRMGFPRFESPDKGTVLLWEKGDAARQFQLGRAETMSTIPVDVSPATVILASHEPSHSDSNLNRRIMQAVGLTRELRVDSQAKYGLLTRREAAVYLRPSKQGYREKTWDHAPGAALLQAVGGTVSDFTGRKLDFTGEEIAHVQGGIVATVGVEHQKIVEALCENH